MSFDEYVKWRDSFIGVPPQPNRRRYLKRIKATWEQIFFVKLKIDVAQSVKKEIEAFLRENHKENCRNKFYSDDGQRRWYVNSLEIAIALKIKFGEYIERSECYEGYGEYLEYCREVQGGNLSFQ